MLVQNQQAVAPDGAPFNIITLTNEQNMSIQLMDWGATWLSCKVPVQQQLREVLLGTQPQDYPKHKSFMGATIGRYANRIANASFELNSEKIQLEANRGKNQLHGGENGFDKRRWHIEKCGQDFVTFSLFSADGEAGFPGSITMTTTYRLTEDNIVEIMYQGTPDKDTALNLTNHAYFNLNNAEQSNDIRAHSLQLNADYFLPVDQEGIPNASLSSVENTSFDFREAKPIGLDFLQEMQQTTVGGYDHAFLLRPESNPAAILSAYDNSLSLQLFTSQPALQVYTCNHFAGTPNRTAGTYNNYAGIALEPEALPDTPNHPEWWHYGGITKANETYHQWIKYQFIAS